jgi:ribosomal protein S18 acetylase RimI-like enzyme
MSPEKNAPSTAKIRRLKASEKDEYKELRLRALLTDRMSFGSSFEKESKSTDEKWADMAQRGASSPETEVLVAQQPDGAFVGMVGSYTKGDVSYVWGMWVDPGHRNRGLGGKLLDAILQSIESSHPTTSIKLGVVLSPEAAVRLYRSRGFVETGHTEPLEHTPSVVWHEMIRRAPRGGS